MELAHQVFTCFWFFSLFFCIYVLYCEAARFYRESKLRKSNEIKKIPAELFGTNSTNVRYIKRNADADTSEAIQLTELARERARNGEFESVIVVALLKDGTQWFKSTNMSQYEKSFLLTFFQAIVNDWFRLGGHE